MTLSHLSALDSSKSSQDISSKPHMGSPMVCLHFSLVILQGQCQGHSGFEGLYVINEPTLPICYS